MQSDNRPHADDDEDDLLAELTDIAYRALLRQGLRRSFLDVEGMVQKQGGIG